MMIIMMMMMKKMMIKVIDFMSVFLFTTKVMTMMMTMI